MSSASLNHIYRTVWNQALGAMVAVAEIESSGGQSGGTRTRNRANALKNALSELAWPPGLAVVPLSIAIGFSGLTGYFADAHAQTLPQGGVAVHGTATSNYSQPGRLTVTTTNGAGTAHSATNWNSFSIGAGATTQINQPNAASMSINRVVTNTPSQLFGTLSSNGRVVLVNQSGIAVGAGALIDTAGFTASAVGMKDADALAGRLRFGGSELGNHTGALTVEGNIIARGGDVVLIAPSIDLAKTAVVEAKNGSVSLVAGQKVEITGRGLEGITLEVQAPADQAINLGSLKGDAVGIFAGTLKHSGLIQAVAADMQGGKVVLRATGDARVDGNAQVLARGDAAGAKGGTVDVLGNRVAVADNALIDVSGQSGGGKIRVGGGFQGKEADVPNAEKTFFGRDATLKADAIDSGNGGTVIVWADVQTKAFGSISAQGGSQAGDGGFVEVSGKERLIFEAKVNALASHGKVGTLLLDPNSINIQSSGGNVSFLSEVDEFSDGPAIANIDVALINSAGATVVLQANDDINVSAPIVMANDFVGVTMRAGRYLTVNQSITTKAGVVTLVAHDPGSLNSHSQGGLYLNAGIDTTSGGSFGAGANVNLTNTASDVAGNSVYLDAIVNAGLSTVNINGQWADQDTNSSIIAGNLGVLLTAGGANLNRASNNIAGSVAINAQGVVNFRNSAPVFSISSVGGINGISGVGNVMVQTTGSVNTTQTVSSSTGDVSIIAPNGVGLVADLVANNGSISINTAAGNGDIIQSGGAITAGIATSLNAGSGNISLGNTQNELSQLSVTNAGNLTIQNGVGDLGLNNITANAISIMGQGDIYSLGAVIQSSSGGISIASTAGLINLAADGVASLIAPGAVTLSSASTLRAGPVNSTIGPVTLNAVGNVTQAGALTTPGGLVVNAGTSDVTLNSASNSFSSLVATGAAVSVTKTGALNLGNVAASASLNLVSGALTQAGGTAITSPTATFSAGAGNITLNNTGNNVGTLTFNPGQSPISSGNVSWVNVGPLTLGEVNANNLSVTTAGGAIAQTAALTRVANAATFDTNFAGGVVLNNSGNDFGTVSLNVGLGEIRDANDMTMATITAHGLDLQAAGTLNLPANPISVSNDLRLSSGTSLTTVNNLSAANIYLQSNNGDINLGGAMVQSTGLLSMAANSGSINAASAAISVGTTLTATATGGGNVTMSNQAFNTFYGGVNLSGAAIDVRADSAINVASLTQTMANQPLRLEAAGILDLPNTALNTGTADLTLKSGGALATEGALTGRNITLEAASNLMVRHNVTSTGNISLTSTGGTVAVNDQLTGVSIVSAGAATGLVTLQAGSVIDLYGNINLVRNAPSSNPVDFRFNAPAGVINGTNGSILTVDGQTGLAYVVVGNGREWSNFGTVNLNGQSTVRLPNEGGYATFANSGSLNINSSAGYSFVSDPTVQGGLVNNSATGTINVNGQNGGNGTGWEARFSQATGGVLNMGAGKILSMQHAGTVDGLVNLGSSSSTLWVSEGHASTTEFVSTQFSGAGKLQIGGGTYPVTAFFGATTGHIAQLELANSGSVMMSGAFSAIDVGSYTQSANSSFTGPGNLTITQSYNNPSAATFQPTGTLNITQQTGNLNLVGAAPLNLEAMTLNAQNGSINVNGNVTVANALSMTANSGSVNAAAAQFDVGGNTTAVAVDIYGGVNVDMSNPANVFGGTVTLQGAAIDVRAASALNVGAIGQIDVNQPLRLEAGGLLTLPNTALATGTSDLTLKSGGALTIPNGLAGRDITLQSGAGQLTLASSVSATGDLSLTSTGGHIMQTGGPLTVVGATAVDAGINDISLANLANVFGTISLVGHNITLQSGSGITITDMFNSVGNPNFGNVFIQTNGPLNLPVQQILASGQVTLNTADVLTPQGRIVGTDIILHGGTGLVVGHDVEASGFLNLEAPNGLGGVQLAIGSRISATGHTHVDGGGNSVNLASNRSNSFSTMSVASPGGDVLVTNGGAIEFGDVRAANFTVVAEGSILQTPAKDIQLSGNAVLMANAGNIALTSPGNVLNTLTATATGDVVVVDAGTSLYVKETNALGLNVTARAIASDRVITVGTSGLSLTATDGDIQLSPDAHATIVSGGDIGLSATGTITAPGATFSMPAGATVTMAAGGLMTLPTAGLNVGSTGTIDLQSGDALNVNGPLTGYNVTLQSVGTTTIAANINAAQFLSVTSTAGDIIQTAGAIISPWSTSMSADGDIQLTRPGNDFYVISATTSNGDININDGVGNLEYFTIAAGGSVYINSQGALLKHTGGNYIQSNGSGYGSINLSAESIGTINTPLVVDPGAVAVSLTARSGGITVQQQTGVMDLSSYSISAAGIGQEIRLLGSAGAGDHVNVSFGGWSLNTQNDDIAILAQGANANVNANGLSKTGRQFALGALGSGGAVNIGTDGVTLHAANGVDLFALSGNVNLAGNLRNDLGFIRLTAGNSILGNGFTTITTTGGNFEATANASLSGLYGSFVPSNSGSIALDDIFTSGANGIAGNTSAEATGQSGGSVSLAVTGGTGSVTAQYISTRGGNGVEDYDGHGNTGGNGGNVTISAPGNLTLNLTIDASAGQGGAGIFFGSNGGAGGHAGTVTLSAGNNLNFQGTVYALGGFGGDAGQDPLTSATGGSAGNAGIIELNAGGTLHFGGATYFNNYPGFAGLNYDGSSNGSSFLQPVRLNAVDITQSVGAAINAGGLIVRFAAMGEVNLSDPGNLFGEMDGTATGNISIVGLSGVGDNGMTAGGNLSLTGIANTPLAIQGPLTAVDIALTGDNAGISLMDHISASGNLTFDVGNCGCPINQTQGDISAIGITTVHAGLSNVTLFGNSNSFNQLAINPLNAAGQGGLVSVYSTTPLNLLDVNAGTLLLATTNDAIAQQAGTAVAVGGAVTFDTGTGNISLTNTGNSFGSLGIQSGGNVVIRNASASLGLHGLNAGSIDLLSAGDVGTDSNITTTVGALTINAGGDVNLATDAAAIVTSQGVTTIRAMGALDVHEVAFNSLGGGDLVLGAVGNLSANLSTVNFATGGRWLTYLSNPGASHVFGMFNPLALVAGDFRQVNAPFGTAPAQATGNGSLWSDAPTGISLTLGGTVNKTYDGGTSISTTGAFVDTASGLLFGEANIGLSGTTATLADKHAGAGRNVTFTGPFGGVVDAAGVPTYGYTLPTTLTASIADVAKAALVVSAVADSRTYNGTTSSSAAPVIGGTQFDAVGTAATQSFDSKHAGGGKTLAAVGLVMNDGNSGNNYDITYNTVGTGTITPAPLTVTAQTDSRVYDATTNSSVVPVVSGAQFDAIGTAASQSFDSRHAGAGKTLAATGLVMNDGNSGNNYAVTYTSVSTGTINKANLTLNAASDSKTYDGTTSSAGLVGSSGLFAGDTVSAASQVFASKNVLGTGASTLQVAGYTVNDGNSGNNYNVLTNTASGTINKANLTVSAVTDSRTYDGTTSSAVSASAVGLVGGDSLSGTSQAFASKNVLGTGGSTLQVGSFSVNDGNSGGNYNLITNTASGTINKANLTVSAVTDSKTYDGTTSSAGAVGSSGLFAGDTVSAASQVFDSKNAGSRTLSVAAYTVNDGNSGNNYNVLTNTASGTINKANLTLNAAGDSKTYDGTTNSAGVVGSSGLFGSDSVSGASQVFASKNVLGTGASTLQVAGYTVNDGNSGNNYNVLTNTAGGTIGKASLSGISGVTAANKTYDGNTAAVVNTVAASAFGVIGSDVVTVSGGAGAFGDKNAGMAKLVTVGGLTLGGTDGGNYQFGGTTTATADINKAVLTGISGVTALNKVYDGNVAADLNTSTAAISGLVSGDSVSVISGVGAFSDRHVGTGKLVSIVGINLGGPDSGNYTFGSFSSTANADITQRALSTWTGSVNSLWSNSGNWDALPDAANVRAVSIPAGLVVFDSSVAPTQLERITSGGRLIMNGGNLSVSDSLRTFQFGQAGGLLNGAGQLIVENRFLKTGGVINMDGLVNITQSTGGLEVGGIRGGNLLLKAESGGITQNGPIATPGALGVQATEAIVLNDPDNRMSEFLAVTKTGNVVLTNIGPLNILGIGAANGNIIITNTGGIRTTGLVAAPLGRVRMTANSPITIGPDGIIALGDIELFATNLTSAGNMLINGNLTSTGGAISLDAANNLTQNASLSAVGAITAQAGGLISFGPVAISSGNPVSYRSATGTVPNPPASVGELISRNSGASNGGTTINEFLAKFEEALDAQQNKSDDENLKKKKQGDVVVEGETCRP